MEVTKELIERVLSYEKSINSWRNNFNSIEYIEASAVNKHFFGKHLNQTRNCDCVKDMFNLVKHKLRKQSIIEIMEKQFVIRKSSLIQSSHFQKPIDHTSSDEDCIKLLKLNPKLINKFEKYPANWEEVVLGKQTNKPVKEKAEVTNNEVVNLSEMTLKELKAYAEEKGIVLISNKKADVVKEIEKSLKA